MSTDAGSAAAPEDAATREESSERPGLESGDPQSADSATSTPETADRGVGGSARSSAEADEESDEGSPDAEAGSDAADADDSTDAEPTVTEPTVTERTDTADEAGVDDSSGDGADGGDRDPSPANEGFMTTILRDATITGLPGETGMPPVEPHSPEAEQEGDEPVGSEPRTGDNPDGVD